MDQLIIELTKGGLFSIDWYAEILKPISDSNFFKALLLAPFLLIYYFQPNKEKSIEVLKIIFSCFIAIIITWIFTTFWHRPRPMVEYDYSFTSELFDYTSTKFHWGSFPSDHMAYLTALSFGLLRLNKKLGFFAISISVLTQGFVRVLLGLHYFSDIMVGVIIGILSLTLVVNVFSRLPKLIYKLIEKWWLFKFILILVIIEMSVMFDDLRSIDRLLFPID